MSMSTDWDTSETSEGSQELRARRAVDPRELAYELGGVLRLPEGVDLDFDDTNVEVSDDEKDRLRDRGLYGR